MGKFVIGLLFVLIPSFFYAAPFGLEMGMTLADITETSDGVEPKHIENDCYAIFPSKKHPLFKNYIAFVDNEKGLYCIRAVSDDMKTNDYGTEIKNAFAEIEERVSKTYGRPRITDEIDPRSMWHEDKYWIKAISDGVRTYAAIWKSSSNNKLKDNLDFVSIYANAQSYPQIGWIILEYEFSNTQAVEDSQDDVF